MNDSYFNTADRSSQLYPSRPNFLRDDLSSVYRPKDDALDSVLDNKIMSDLASPPSLSGVNIDSIDIGNESLLTKFQRSYCSISLKEGVRLSLDINVTNLLLLIIFIVLFIFIILPESEDGDYHFIWGIVLGTASYFISSTFFRCLLN